MPDLQGGKDPLACICQSTECPSIPIMFYLATAIVITTRHVGKCILDFCEDDLYSNKEV